MNIDRLHRLIRMIAGATDEQFDISWVFSSDGHMIRAPTVADMAASRIPGDVRYYGDCGTAACIAGWCGLAAQENEIAETEPMVRRYWRYNDPDTPLQWTTRTALEWLGISEVSAAALFTPPGYSTAPVTFPRIRALRVLEHMARVYEAGGGVVVRWDLFDLNGEVVAT